MNKLNWLWRISSNFVASSCCRIQWHRWNWKATLSQYSPNRTQCSQLIQHQNGPMARHVIVVALLSRLCNENIIVVRAVKCFVPLALRRAQVCRSLVSKKRWVWFLLLRLLQSLLFDIELFTKYRKQKLHCFSAKMREKESEIWYLLYFMLL